MLMRGGPEAELKRCGDMRPAIDCQEGNESAFVLNLAGETEARSGEDVGCTSNTIWFPH